MRNSWENSSNRIEKILQLSEMSRDVREWNFLELGEVLLELSEVELKEFLERYYNNDKFRDTIVDGLEYGDSEPTKVLSEMWYQLPRGHTKVFTKYGYYPEEMIKSLYNIHLPDGMTTELLDDVRDVFEKHLKIQEEQEKDNTRKSKKKRV